MQESLRYFCWRLAASRLVLAYGLLQISALLLPAATLKHHNGGIFNSVIYVMWNEHVFIPLVQPFSAVLHDPKPTTDALTAKRSPSSPRHNGDARRPAELAGFVLVCEAERAESLCRASRLASHQLGVRDNSSALEPPPTQTTQQQQAGRAGSAATTKQHLTHRLQLLETHQQRITRCPASCESRARYKPPAYLPICRVCRLLFLVALPIFPQFINTDRKRHRKCFPAKEAIGRTPRHVTEAERPTLAAMLVRERQYAQRIRHHSVEL